MAKESKYASAHNFGDRLDVRVWTRNSVSRVSGSGRNAMRESAQILSHRSQAWDMLRMSFPIMLSVVRSRRTVNCVKRQKKNCSSSDRSNHSFALSECTCRLQSKASQTFASRKFNTFIDLFVGKIDFGTFGNDQRKADPFRSRALAFQ